MEPRPSYRLLWRTSLGSKTNEARSDRRAAQNTGVTCATNTVRGHQMLWYTDGYRNRSDWCVSPVAPWHRTAQPATLTTSYDYFMLCVQPFIALPSASCSLAARDSLFRGKAAEAWRYLQPPPQVVPKLRMSGPIPPQDSCVPLPCTRHLPGAAICNCSMRLSGLHLHLCAASRYNCVLHDSLTKFIWKI